MFELKKKNGPVQKTQPFKLLSKAKLNPCLD